MPAKRRTPKARAHRVTAEAVEAFAAGDYMRLHDALDLRPWEASPLPLSVTPLGCDPDNPPPAVRVQADPTGWDGSWAKAVQLQAELMAAVQSNRGGR